MADLGKTLDRNMDDILRRLYSTLRAVNARIQDEVLTKVEKATLLDASAKIAYLLGAFDDNVDRIAGELQDAAKLARDEFYGGEAFTTTDAQLINAMIQDTADELKAVGLSTASQISEVVYAGVIAGQPMADLREHVRQLLLGGTDKRGRSLANHAGTITETRYMQVFATATRLKAEQAGHDKFRYAGTLVRDSRPWCKQHLDQVLTMDEIKAWRHKSWEGKAPGDPFITRGGWRCRHYWRPIID